MEHAAHMIALIRETARREIDRTQRLRLLFGKVCSTDPIQIETAGVTLDADLIEMTRTARANVSDGCAVAMLAMPGGERFLVLDAVD